MRKIRMTPENRRRSAVVAATGMAALLGAGVFAVPAAAHTGTWSVSCDSVTVHLTAYNKRATNSVTLSVEGGGVLAKEDSFGAGYDFSSPLPPHDAAITLHLVVTAGDSAKYNIDQEKTAAPCEGQTTAPPPPTTTPAPPPTTTPAPPAHHHAGHHSAHYGAPRTSHHRPGHPDRVHQRTRRGRIRLRVGRRRSGRNR